MLLSLESRACPICRLRDAALVHESNVDERGLDGFAFASRKAPEYMHHRLVQCLSCSLLYANPAPAADTLGRLYHTADFDSSAEARQAARTYAERLPEIVARLPRRQAALDVGTGAGEFLEELLAAGFTQVQGVEPSAKPVASASPAVRKLIVQDVFRPESFTAGSLDLISCFQTLEHLPDPAAFCRDAHRLLADGGALYVVAHDRRALSARVLGTRSPIYDLEHLQLFCRASLERLMRGAGFREVRIRPVWNTYALRYWLRLFPFPPLLKRAVLAFADATGMGRVPLRVPAGNLAAVAFK